MRSRVDSIISSTLLYKGWNGVSGLISIPFIAYGLDPVAQGVFYTFLSLAAIRGFIELGLSSILVIFASHEWSVVEDSTTNNSNVIKVARARLTSLTKFTLKYYIAGASLFFIVAVIVGEFVMGDIRYVNWFLPWIIHVSATSVLICLAPLLSIYEGCSNVAKASMFRFYISFVGSIALVLTLFFGGGLWALPVSAVSQLMTLVIITLHLNKTFFAGFWRHKATHEISWVKEILPMQWRLAVQALVGYFSFPFFTVLSFKTLGAVQAGQLGMTLQIIAGMQVLGLVFLVARSAELANLTSIGKTKKFFSRWRSYTKQTILMTAFFVACVLVVSLLGASVSELISQRLLPVKHILMLSIGVVLMVVPQSIAVFFRVNKIEVFTSIGVVTGICMGGMSYALSQTLGLVGFSLAYMLVAGLITAPTALYIYKARSKEVLQ